MACMRPLRCKLHEGDHALDAAGTDRGGARCRHLVADRMTPGPGEIFPKLPALRAFVRCAVDIRNIDVAAASADGVLVTQASPGFVQSVAELALGFMVDLSRGVSRATADYHAGRMPEVAMGRQLAGSQIGIIGYGSIGRYLALPCEGDGHGSAGRRSLCDHRRRRRSSMCRSTICSAIRLCRLSRCRQRADRKPDRAGGAGADAAARFLYQFVARQSRRRSGAGGGIARQPHCRRGDGCRPRAGPDAGAGTRKAART